jgi:hypothetical protein
MSLNSVLRGKSSGGHGFSSIGDFTFFIGHSGLRSHCFT